MIKAGGVQKNIILAGFILAITALIGTGLMSLVNAHSKPFIIENEKQTLLRSLNSVVSLKDYDNDILNDVIKLKDYKYLGKKEKTTIYRARKNNKPSAAVLTVATPNGYSGEINLLVGISYNGTITGVRITRHRETPGLGDAIDIKRSNWIESFTGKSLNNPLESNWKVKRDGGHFDQFTGATITPRAVVGAVHNALVFFKKNRDLIFEAP